MSEQSDDLPAAGDAEAPSPLPEGPGQAGHTGRWWVLGSVLSVLALACVGAGVLVGFQVIAARRAAPDALQDRYRLAEQHYRHGRYAQAVEACRALRDGAPESLAARRARVLMRSAQTRIALEAGDLKSARRKLATAEELLDELADVPALAKWVAAVRADRDLLPRLATEWAESQRVLTAAKQMLVQGETRGALHFLAREVPGVKLSVQQQNELRDLRTAIYQALFKDAVRKAVSTGRHLTDLQRFNKADWAFAEAQTNLQEADQMGYLTEADYKTLARAIAEGVEKLANARDFALADEAIRVAREEGKLSAERDALRRALRTTEQIRPSRVVGLRDRLKVVELEIAFADVLERARQAGEDEAVAMLAEFVAAHPEHTEAASALRAMESDLQWGKLIAAGDAAARAGNWAGALKQYGAAARTKTDTALEDRLDQTRYEIAMQEAREARRQKRYDDALAAAARAALACPPAAAGAKAWQQETRRQQKYEADLVAAKAALAAADRKEAARILEAVQPQTPEVLALRDQVAYQQERQSALNAMRRRDYRAAYEHLKTAKERARPGEETRQIIELMSRVEPLLRPVMPPPAPAPAPPERLGLIRSPLLLPSGTSTGLLYSNGYFPGVSFGSGQQIYLGGASYPVFHRRRGSRFPATRVRGLRGNLMPRAGRPARSDRGP